MAKRAVKEKATSYKKRKSVHERKYRKRNAQLTRMALGITKAQNMAAQAQINEQLLPKIKELGKSITKKRAIKKVKALQSVAVRKIGRQFPPTAIHTVLSMLR